MAAQDSINKEIDLAPGKDFFALLSAGIDKITQVAADTWNDYNEHDPGITILEQLAYALTEIGYKADLPIADLLCNFDGTIDTNANFFFSPAQILTINAVTKNDYRKLLMDHFPEINNVWIDGGTGTDAGRKTITDESYNVSVALKSIFSDSRSIKNKENEIREFLNSNRNLSERFLNVSVLKPHLIGISGKFQVKHNADPEKILEQILLNLKEFINPSIKIKTVNQLLDEGVLTQDIFSGPAAQNGYIKTDDLNDAIAVITIPQLLKEITSIQGILNVDEIALTSNGKQYSITDASSVKIGSDEMAMFDVDNTLNSVKLYLKEVELFPSVKFIKANYYLKKNKHKSPYVLNTSNASLDIAPPTGNYTAIDNYYSIKNQFPGVYGLAENINSLSDARKAQVNQLKAYLAFFEQHLANTLSQLANAKNLFNFSSPEKVNYSKSILDDAGMDKILDPGYLQKMDLFLNDPEKSLAKMNLFLTHVLSRFSEQVNLYQSNKKSQLDTADFRDSEADLKLELLKAFVKYSPRKALAPQYGPDDKGQVSQTELTGIEQKMQQILGWKDLNNDDKRSFFIIEHFLFDQSGGGNIPAAFYRDTVSFVLLINNEEYRQDNYKQYLTEMIGHICPAHLMPFVIFLDPHYKSVIDEFRSLFNAWINKNQNGQANGPVANIDDELAIFIYNSIPAGSF